LLFPAKYSIVLVILLYMFFSVYSDSLCCSVCVLFVCKCVLSYYQRVSAQLQLTNIFEFVRSRNLYKLH